MHWFERRHRRQAYNRPGDAHELTFCCRNRYQLLSAEETCQWLAEAIESARKQIHFSVWAYVFMPTHAHIIVHPEVEAHDLSSILKAIKEPVARKAIAFYRKQEPAWIPRLAVERGRRVVTVFWQPGGGYDRNVNEPETLSKMIDYIHLNPVRGGLVDVPEKWKWSSAGWFAGQVPNGLKPDPIPAGWGVVSGAK